MMKQTSPLKLGIMIVIIVGCSTFAAVKLIDYARNSSNDSSWDSPRRGPGPAPGRQPFDMSSSLIPVAEIEAGGPPKDGIPALTNPKFIKASEAAYLEPGDMVIGVKMGNESRAYPLRILDLHEIVNDVVAGKEIAVTYCPLCRSALVFDRQVAGQVREFGVSGLLWNSNVLMYDRQDSQAEESLWSQIMMKAVTGFASEEGARLTLLPSTLSPWRQWRQAHPQTQVLSPNTGHNRDYQRSVYGGYFNHDNLSFPVKANGQRPERFRNKEPMVLVQSENKWKAYAIQDIAAGTDEKVYLEDQVAQNQLCLNYTRQSDIVQVEMMDNKDLELPVAYMFWFSLNAILPEVEIYQPPAQTPES